MAVMQTTHVANQRADKSSDIAYYSPFSSKARKSGDDLNDLRVSGGIRLCDTKALQQPADDFCIVCDVGAQLDQNFYQRSIGLQALGYQVQTHTAQTYM